MIVSSVAIPYSPKKNGAPEPEPPKWYLGSEALLANVHLAYPEESQPTSDRKTHSIFFSEKKIGNLMIPHKQTQLKPSFTHQTGIALCRLLVWN